MSLKHGQREEGGGVKHAPPPPQSGDGPQKAEPKMYPQGATPEKFKRDRHGRFAPKW